MPILTNKICVPEYGLEIDLDINATLYPKVLLLKITMLELFILMLPDILALKHQ